MHVVLARIWLGHVDGSLWHRLSILHHGWLLWDLHRLLWVLLGSGRGIMVFKLVCLLLRRYSWRHHDLLMSWILRRMVLGLHHLVLLITLIHAGCLLSSILGGVLVVNGVVQLLLHLIGMPHLWIRRWRATIGCTGNRDAKTGGLTDRDALRDLLLWFHTSHFRPVVRSFQQKRSCLVAATHQVLVANIIPLLVTVQFNELMRCNRGLTH